ncbi:MAG: hypothetical protein BroJett029_18790 [Alphaproteobacteria bacterium]|nr:MAG: hypothetical protein BroJett029_18790 [Alphaproteobacteria bacterium]
MPSGKLPVLLLALLLAVAGALPMARAEGPRPFALDFYVDMSDDILADAGIEPGEDLIAAREVMIAGLPLIVGGHEGAIEGGWHTVAGGTGRYRAILADGLSMTSTLRAARTDFIDDRTGKAVGAATTEFRYATGSWLFGLQPSAEITRWDTEVTQQDAVIEARLSRAIAGGLSLASTARYRWREMIGGDATDRELASGRIGLAGRLPGDARVDVAYVVRQEIAFAQNGGALANGTLNAGPTLAIALPLGGTIDLKGNYEFTETRRYDEADPIRDGQTQQQHRLGLAASWDVGGEDFDIELSASYRYECTTPFAAGPDDIRHRGSVTVAMPF